MLLIQHIAILFFGDSHAYKSSIDLFLSNGQYIKILTRVKFNTEICSVMHLKTKLRAIRKVLTLAIGLNDS